MNAIFTCSVDDGNPSDMRMAELLSKYRLNATFFIPIINREGKPVMSASQIREIGTQFEIGSHTLDHCYLETVNLAEASRQITEGKHRLEDLLGSPVAGFCYPGGKYRKAHLEMVQSAGFGYARTITNLRFDAGESRFEMPTTMQFYPHARSIYLRNFLSSGDWLKRSEGLRLALRHDQWIERLYALFDYSCQLQGVFHLWGHSEDIDRLDAWREIDRFFDYVTKQVPADNRLSNRQLAVQRFH
jgi:peptidoglycan/xylan/chitin deacetylase (PgdA/CDA1 family)